MTAVLAVALTEMTQVDPMQKRHEDRKLMQCTGGMYSCIWSIHKCSWLHQHMCFTYPNCLELFPQASGGVKLVDVVVHLLAVTSEAQDAMLADCSHCVCCKSWWCCAAVFNVLPTHCLCTTQVIMPVPHELRAHSQADQHTCTKLVQTMQGLAPLPSTIQVHLAPDAASCMTVHHWRPVQARSLHIVPLPLFCTTA